MPGTMRFPWSGSLPVLTCVLSLPSRQSVQHREAWLRLDLVPWFCHLCSAAGSCGTLVGGHRGRQVIREDLLEPRKTRGAAWPRVCSQPALCASSRREDRRGQDGHLVSPRALSPGSRLEPPLP